MDFPSSSSLLLIYEHFASAVFRNKTGISKYSNDVVLAMIDVYEECRKKFKSIEFSHYVYSPRELTRWMRGISNLLIDGHNYTLETVIKIWAYEGMRLFSDRLVSKIEKDWTWKLLIQTVQTRFPLVALVENEIPLFSKWIQNNSSEITLPEMRKYLNSKMKIFQEEESAGQIILFDEAIDHILRIDRAFRYSLNT